MPLQFPFGNFSATVLGYIETPDEEDIRIISAKTSPLPRDKSNQMGGLE